MKKIRTFLRMTVECSLCRTLFLREKALFRRFMCAAECSREACFDKFLLVNDARKTNVAARRLFFFYVHYITCLI